MGSVVGTPGAPDAASRRVVVTVGGLAVSETSERLLIELNPVTQSELPSGASVMVWAVVATGRV